MPSVSHGGVVRDDQCTGRQLWLQQLGHRKVELLPAVEQHEADRPVDGRQRGQGVAFEDGDEIVEDGLGERLLRLRDLFGAQLGGDHAACAVVAHR